VSAPLAFVRVLRCFLDGRLRYAADTQLPSFMLASAPFGIGPVTTRSRGSYVNGGDLSIKATNEWGTSDASRANRDGSPYGAAVVRSVPSPVRSSGMRERLYRMTATRYLPRAPRHATTPTA